MRDQGALAAPKPAQPESNSPLAPIQSELAELRVRLDEAESCVNGITSKQMVARVAQSSHDKRLSALEERMAAAFGCIEGFSGRFGDLELQGRVTRRWQTVDYPLEWNRAPGGTREILALIEQEERNRG